MFLCYQCYSKKFNDDKWETFFCDTEVKETCENCHLVGIFVRDIKEEK